MHACFKVVSMLVISVVLSSCTKKENYVLLNDAEEKLKRNPTDKTAWDVVEKFSKDSEVFLRIQAVYVAGNLFGRVHNDQVEKLAWPIVFGAFDDADAQVRGAAYQCAEEFKDKVDILLPRLEHGLTERAGRPEVFAANTLGKFGTAAKKAVPAMVAQLAEGPRSKGGDLGQQAAARALGHLRRDSEEATPVLEKCVHDFQDDPEFLFLIVSNLNLIDPNNPAALDKLKDFENGKYGDFLASQAKWYLDPNQAKP